MIKKILLLLLLIYSSAYSKSYTLYLASTKYLDIAKKYYEDIKLQTPDFYDLIIRTHVKKNYSVIIRNIPDIQKAKKIQKLLIASDKYKDSYIKKFNKEPDYNIIEMESSSKVEPRTTKDIKETIYKQEVEETNEYITASTMFNTQQYKKAYELFYELFLENTYNLNINYFLAKSAFSIKKFDEAIAAYERVLILKPNFNQARYDYARILYKLKQKEEAKSEFNKLLDAKIDTKIKTKIKEYLKILNKKQKRKSISAKIMIGVNSSSNINNGLNKTEYKLPGIDNIEVSGEKPISDIASSQMINLNLFNYSKIYPLRFKNSFYLFNKNFLNEKNENLTVFSYKPELTYLDKENKNLYILELATDKIVTKNNENFYAFSISPKIKTRDFSTYLKYQRIYYTLEENKEKDFEKIQFYTKLNLFENMNYYIDIYKDSRIDDLRTDIDNKTFGNGVNLFYDINQQNKVNLNYQIQYSKYKYKNIGFDSIRKDTNQVVEFSLVHLLNKDSIIHFGATYNKNNSNQEAYKYNENAFQINYLKELVW